MFFTKYPESQLHLTYLLLSLLLEDRR